jgi:hypothetical protein
LLAELRERRRSTKTSSIGFCSAFRQRVRASACELPSGTPAGSRLNGFQLRAARRQRIPMTCSLPPTWIIYSASVVWSQKPARDFYWPLAVSSHVPASSMSRSGRSSSSTEGLADMDIEERLLRSIDRVGAPRPHVRMGENATALGRLYSARPSGGTLRTCPSPDGHVRPPSRRRCIPAHHPVTAQRRRSTVRPSFSGRLKDGVSICRRGHGPVSSADLHGDEKITLTLV